MVKDQVRSSMEEILVPNIAEHGRGLARPNTFLGCVLRSYANRCHGVSCSRGCNKRL